MNKYYPFTNNLCFKQRWDKFFLTTIFFRIQITFTEKSWADSTTPNPLFASKKRRTAGVCWNSAAELWHENPLINLINASIERYPFEHFNYSCSRCSLYVDWIYMRRSRLVAGKNSRKTIFISSVWVNYTTTFKNQEFFHSGECLRGLLLPLHYNNAFWY